MPKSPAVDTKLAADKNLSDVADAPTARSNIGAGSSLVRTAVKTSAYTAAAGDLVPVDTTSAGVTVTLPNAPATGTRVAVKHVIQGSTNTVTVAAAGSDVFNKTGGSTSVTLTLVNQSVQVQYDGGIWSVVAGDLPLSGLDARYAAAGSGGGGSSLTVQDEGSALTTAATTVNFVGAGVTASGTGATKTVTIPGGSGSSVNVQDEGSALTTAADTLNFVGAGVDATGTGTTKTITIPGGVSTGSWQTLTLNGGGVACTGCAAPAARTEGTELVRFRGVGCNFLITAGTVTASSGGGTFTPPATPIINLPAGLRPTARRGLRAMGSSGSVLQFYVETNGDIWAAVALGVSQIVSFDGATFTL